MLNAFWVQLKTSSAVNLQYRAANLIWLIGAVLEPVIYLVVWDTVAKVQGGSVGGFTSSDFAAYFLALMVVDRLTFTWIMWEYEFFIREGTLSRRLLRPMHPFWVDVADNLAYKAFIMVVLIPTVLLLMLFFRPSFETAWLDLVAFVPALVLAFILRFCLEWALAMTAFWTTRINAINQVYFVVFLFFSGRLAPLELLPSFAQTLADVLPFRWMLSFPLEVLLGRLSAQEIAAGYGAQLVWTAAAVVAMLLAWRSGVKQFSAVGT
jgi:ABC-2 type transport system permease protein